MSLAKALAASPKLLPHSLDPATDRCLLIEMDEAAVRAASFLDQRIITAATRGRWVPLPELVEAAATLPERWQGLFHVGHVGSTLVARMLGELPAFHVLREPAALRTLAEALGDPACWWSEAMRAERGRAVGALWSRGWRDGQRVLLKASSFASGLAAAHLARADRPRALFLSTAPERYLATILGQDGNRQEARALAANRLKRLRRLLDAPVTDLWSMREGEWVALGWLTEMLHLAAADPGDGRALWLDFEQFLADPAAGLAAAALHLGAPADPAAAQAIAAGPLMGRYSKAPEHAYSPALRAEVLAAARAEQGESIHAGLDWLEAMAARFPPIAALLANARTTSA